MRAALCFLALAACVLLVTVQAQPLDEVPLSRFRREGEVNVDVDKQRGEKPRVTVHGESNVWKDNNRRVDIRGSADNRGNRGVGASFKW